MFWLEIYEWNRMKWQQHYGIMYFAHPCSKRILYPNQIVLWVLFGAATENTFLKKIREKRQVTDTGSLKHILISPVSSQILPNALSVSRTDNKPRSKGNHLSKLWNFYHLICLLCFHENHTELPSAKKENCKETSVIKRSLYWLIDCHL